MTEEERTYFVLQGMLMGMEEDTRKAILEAEIELKAVIKKHGDFGIVALALLGARQASEASKAGQEED